MDPSISLDMLQQFHFIRPEWLWGLPLVVLLWLVLRNQTAGQQWSSHIPKEMLAALQIGTTKQSSAWKWSLLILWLGVVIAAAGPTWNKQDAPTVQNQKALVLLLDLSPSMLAQDLIPDRLSRAKYKLIDVLRLQADGQVALIAYAGDAHTVSPLTDDPKTIQALLPALHPDIMPSRGSNTEAAVELAQQLMRDAGLSRGEILLITDGVNEDAIETIIDDIDTNYRLSVLAVGGGDAAPIPEANGGFLRRTNGEIILSAVNGSELRSMAARLGGRFSMLTSDNADIDSLLADGYEAADDTDQAQLSSAVYDAWVDMGHWLVLLILPLALVLFRKGTIYLLPLFIPLLLLSPSDSYAKVSTTSATSTASMVSTSAWQTGWNNLWRTPDQQASEQFSAGDFDSAAKTFEQKDWAALSNYNNGDYQQAIEKLQGLDDTASLYNKGNALAFNGQLQEAVDAYQQVLDKQADHQDAKHNKSVVEQLLQQQSDQQQESDGSPDENSQDESSESQQGDSESQPSDDDSDSESQPSDKESQEQSEQQQQAEADAEEKAKEQASEKGAEQQSEDESEQQSQAEKDAEDENQESESTNGMAQIEDTDEPLQDSSEQWLRTIPDDPSGLLRRKFDYQARQRVQQSRRQKNDTAAQQRY